MLNKFNTACTKTNSNEYKVCFISSCSYNPGEIGRFQDGSVFELKRTSKSF